jgi:hypothetical protein
MSLLYKAYTDFQKSYYDRSTPSPLLPRKKFQDFTPITVIDLSHQNDNVKSATVELRVEFEITVDVLAKTSAYRLILHDQVITYNPFSGQVRKL